MSGACPPINKHPSTLNFAGERSGVVTNAKLKLGRLGRTRTLCTFGASGDILPELDLSAPNGGLALGAPSVITLHRIRLTRLCDKAAPLPYPSF